MSDKLVPDKLTNEQLEIVHRIGFLQGVVEAIRLYAVWHDGHQYVGVMRKPLAEVLQPYLEEAARLDEKLIWRVQV